MKRRSTMNPRPLWLGLAASLASLLATGLPAGAATPAAPPSAEAPPAPTTAPPESPNRITREGLTIEFSATPLDASELMEAATAEIAFRITDAGSGKPVRGLYPVVYMDIGEAWDALHGKTAKAATTCKQRVGLYLQGLVGIRPMIDLNSYFVLVMNQDPTILVFDPIIGMQGRTNLYAQVVLKRAGADWAKTADEKRLFVSMPVADMVAVVDLERFVVSHNVAAGDSPTRVALQHDEKYLWIGNDARTPAESGVTVIGTDPLRRVTFIPTGAGHHELALSTDDRYAFVTNRDDGTVSVIDVATLAKVTDLRLGPKPITLAYSALSQALYVADGETGEIAVVDADLQVVARIPTAPGLGPVRVSPDGRWAVGVNPPRDEIYVIDASSNRRIHTIPVEGQPFEVSFSPAFAYVRALGTPYVSMVNLKALGKEPTPLVTRFEAGKLAPGTARDLAIAGTMRPAPGEAAMLVVSPADTTVYYYMEGMNAPMGNFRNYGHRPRAVQVADRTLKEREPGVYSAKVKIPAAGTYDVAFLLDTPVVLQCFQTVAMANPLLEDTRDPLVIEYLVEDRNVPVGDATRLRFRLTDPKTQEPVSDLTDVTVLYYPAAGWRRTEVRARPVGDGVYEAELRLRFPQAYYVFVAAPSKAMEYGKLRYFSLRGVRKPVARPVGAADETGRGGRP